MLLHAYGPTETTVISNFLYKPKDRKAWSLGPTYGYDVEYISDLHGNALPNGVRGKTKYSFVDTLLLKFNLKYFCFFRNQNIELFR